MAAVIEAGDDAELTADDDDAALLRCRMHERALPEVDEVVTVRVCRIEEGMGFYAQLLSYGLVEGFVQASEASRVRKGRKPPSLTKLTRVGKVEICVVTRVDAATGCIDLSKWRVEPEERAAAEAAFHRSKAIHAIVRHVAAKERMCSMEQLYARAVWPLARDDALACHPYEAFCLALQRPEAVFNERRTPGLSDGLRAALLAEIRRRLAPGAAVKVQAHVEARCLGRAGVYALRRALLAGVRVGTSEGTVVQAKMIAPPRFALRCACADKATGLALLTSAIAAVRAELEKHAGGAFSVAEAPRAVDESEGDKGAAELAQRLAQLGDGGGEGGDNELYEQDDEA